MRAASARLPGGDRALKEAAIRQPRASLLASFCSRVSIDVSDSTSRPGPLHTLTIYAMEW